ncbi:alpha/beta fold hydrolase [Spirosoma flavum]|uniref:Alpha/beta fold hydrolase n=1 Tax=Spirosoma flavum TaxID=2048557 RepID=A0ABW6ADV9_9BACT
MNKPVSIGLIHGHGVDASIWDSIYADLALDNSVLKPDFAQLTNLTTIDEYADELYARLQAAKVEKVVLVGHSMGGYMALAFAEQHPEMVQALVLYHSTATADDENRRQARQQAIDGLEMEGPSPFIQKQLPKMVAPTYPPEKVQLLVERFKSLPADALIAGMKAIAGRPDRTGVLRNALFPVLLVLGRDDQLIPYEKTAQLADLSNQISVAIIEQAGHLSMIEQPIASIQTIRSFIGKF